MSNVRDRVRELVALAQVGQNAFDQAYRREARLAESEVRQIADLLVQQHRSGYPDLEAVLDAAEMHGEVPTCHEWQDEEAALADLFDLGAEKRGITLRARRK